MGISRRDTIIIAVLINAGLLLILFMTAVRTDGSNCYGPSTNSVENSKNVEMKPDFPKTLVNKEKKEPETISKNEEEPKPKDVNPLLANVAKLTASQEDSPDLPEQTKPPELKKVEPPKEQKEQFYTVASGDTIWHIAMRNNLKIEELLTLNDLDENSARRLRPGDKLRIK